LTAINHKDKHLLLNEILNYNKMEQASIKRLFRKRGYYHY